MRRTPLGLIAAALLLFTLPLGAQGRVAPRALGGAPHAAEQFLARAGELGLTDAQVVRLAAIARRAEARRAATRARLDSITSLRPGGPPDSAARAARVAEMQQLRERMAQEREQATTDLAAALEVLTSEQLARAWMSREARGRELAGARGFGRRALVRPDGRVGPRRDDRPRPERPDVSERQRRRPIQPPNTSAR